MVASPQDLGLPELAEFASAYTFRPPGATKPETWVRVNQVDSRDGWIVTRGTEIWDGEQWASIFAAPERHNLILPLATAIHVARHTVAED